MTTAIVEHSTDTHGPVHCSTSYTHDKARILARLRRLEGQARGVQRMVEDDADCLDVLTQLSAIVAAARATGLLVLVDHLRGCVPGPGPPGQTEVDEAMEEITWAIGRFVRSVG